jgi:hypothetical protein
MSAPFPAKSILHRAGRVLLVDRIDQRGVHLVDEVTGERLGPVPAEDLLAEYLRGDLAVASADESRRVDIAALSDQDRATVAARHAAIRPLLAIEPDRRRSTDYETAARVATRTVPAVGRSEAGPISAATVRGWVEAFEAAGGLAGLARDLAPPEPPDADGVRR